MSNEKVNEEGDFKAMKFPPGFRFEPHDDELIQYYLLPKLHNQELPPNLMHVVNLYQNNPELCDPHQLTEHYEPQGEGKWYFFTSRDRKYPNGSRPNRAAGSGYWKATGCDTEICKIGEQEAGLKKTLVFYTGRPGTKDNKKTNWLMHEYRVGPVKNPSDRETNKRKRKNDDEASNSRSMMLDEWVLCRIYHATEERGKQKPRGVNKDKEGKGNENVAYHGVEENQMQPAVAQHVHCSFVSAGNSSADGQRCVKPDMHDMMVGNRYPQLNAGFQPFCNGLGIIPSSAQRYNRNIVPVDSSNATFVMNDNYCPQVNVLQYQGYDMENIPTSATSNFRQSSTSYSAELSNGNTVPVDNSIADDVMNVNQCPPVKVGFPRQWRDLEYMPSSATSNCGHSSISSSTELFNGNIFPVDNRNADSVMNGNHSPPINVGTPFQLTAATSNYVHLMCGGSDPESMPSLSTSKEACSSLVGFEDLYDDIFSIEDTGDTDNDLSSLADLSNLPDFPSFPDSPADFTNTESNIEEQKVQTTISGQ